MSSTPKIGAVLALDGEKEYKSAITAINTAQKELRAEMKLVTATFSDNQNSVEALTAKSKILEEQHQTQADKVAVCEAAVKKYAETQAAASEKVDAAAKELEEAEAKLEELKDTSDATTEEIEEQEKAVDDAKAALRDANTEYTNATNKTNQWQTSLTNAQADLLKTDKEIENNAQYLDEASNSADGCATSIDQYGKKTKAAGEESEEFGDKTTEALDSVATVLAAGKIVEGVEKITAALTECVEAANEYETALAKVATIADTSTTSLDSMSSEILEAASALGVSSSEIAEATYQAISAGQSTEDAVSFAAQATELAIGGFTDATTAVDILTTALNAYGLEADEASTVSDVLVQIQNKGKTTVSELASSMGRVIPLAASYNVEITNLGAAYATLTANGIATSEATTYLKSMLNELGDSSSTVAGILKTQTGLSFADLSEAGYSLGDVLDILLESVEDDTTAFNELWSSQEAGVGALSIANSGAEAYNKTLAAMEDSAGATSDAYETMADTTAQAQARMETAFENLKIAVGEVFQPALESAYEAGGDLLGWATDFVDEHPEVVAALSAIVIGLGSFATAVTVATAALKAFQLIQSLANPTTLLVTALGSLTVAAAAFAAATTEEYTELQQVNAATEEAVESSKELLDTLETSAAARESDREALESEAAACESLADELVELTSQTELSADEQARAQEITAQLNEALPDLGLSYDALTNSINLSTEELYANIEALNQEAIAAAAQEDLTAIAEEQYEIYKQKLELEEQIAEQMEATTEAQEALNAAMANTEDYSIAQAAYDEASIALAELEEQMALTQEQEELLAEEFAETSEFISDTSALEEATEATETLGDTANDTAASMEDAAEALSETYASIADSIKEAVDSQLDLFAEVEEQSSISSEEVVANMEANVAAVQSWGDNLEILATKSTDTGETINTGLLQYLAELGPEGAAYVQAFVDMTSEELEAANAAWEESLTLSDTIAAQFTEAGENVVAGYVQGLESKSGEASAATSDVAESSLSSFNSSLGENSPSKYTQQSGQYFVAGFEQGLTDETQTLLTQIQTLAEDSLETLDTSLGIEEGLSTLTRQTGQYVDLGLETGMEDGKPELLSTVQSTADETVALMAQELDPSVSEPIGENFAAGLAEGILAGKSGVINAAAEICAAAVTAAKEALDINSPSGVTYELGGYYMQGWEEGILAGTESLKDAATGALSEALVADVDVSADAGTAETASTVNVYFQPQSMTDAELDRAFDYINERFGLAV